VQTLSPGILNVHLGAIGKAVHSGYPHLGKSAIEPMVEVLRDLMHADWPEGTRRPISDKLGTQML
jgi:acetylornithine deacetylase/succinyl-diaminopimelate desuccinylase-like protein